MTAAYAARWGSELERLTADVTPTRPAFVQRRTPATRINPYAIGSLVLSVLWMAWLGSLAGVILGHIALRQIARSEDTESGSGLAIAGLVVGYASLVLLVVAIIFIPTD